MVFTINRYTKKYRCKRVYVYIHTYILLSWFLKAIHHQKELGLWRISTGAEKVQDEPGTSHHARK